MIELRLVGRQKQAAGPVPAAIVRGQPATGLGDAVRARRVGIGNHAIGVADVERIGEKRHAEWLLEAVEERVLRLGDAVAIAVAQERDAVRAVAERRRPSHRRDHGVVEQAVDRVRRGQRFGDEDVAIRQHVDPSRMLEVGRKRVDLKPGSGVRRLSRAPTPGGRHLERREAALRLGEWNGRIAAEGLCDLSAILPPQHDRCSADLLDDTGENF